ncbi:hypothetical protein [Capnocytophaga canis]|uniref:hypothetical protein n=1 Tax=Capnocytophaga canis TaxID=1848903 RepID=UPI001BB35789|nr:hypothetical protein [Capnocytophaga canis]
MKNAIILTLFQAISSLVSGILISQMSFLGRVGISLKYREYLVFKTWWKTALLIFAVHLAIILLLYLLRKLIGFWRMKIVVALLFALGVAGVYLTYQDFTTTMHKVMKQKFHFGFYLFWLNWFITCFYFLLMKKPKIKPYKENQQLHTSKERNHHTIVE